jgi:hypothetical protein
MAGRTSEAADERQCREGWRQRGQQLRSIDCSESAEVGGVSLNVWSGLSGEPLTQVS